MRRLIHPTGGIGSLDGSGAAIQGWYLGGTGARCASTSFGGGPGGGGPIRRVGTIPLLLLHIYSERVVGATTAT